MTYARNTGDPGKRFRHHLMALTRSGFTSTALARAGESADSCTPDEWLVARQLFERLKAGLRPEYLEALLSADAHSHVVRMARQAAFRVLARDDESVGRPNRKIGGKWEGSIAPSAQRVCPVVSELEPEPEPRATILFPAHKKGV